MPHIITTRAYATSSACPRLPAPRAHRAVLTLEGQALFDALMELHVCKGWSKTWDVVDKIKVLPEAGGAIGPLPDGTVIDVECSTWSRLATDVGIDLRWDPPTQDGDYLHDGQRDELAGVIAAYNAKERER